jgi:hypothetical protein
VFSVCPIEIDVKSYRNKQEFIYSLPLLAVVEIYGNRFHETGPGTIFRSYGAGLKEEQ